MVISVIKKLFSSRPAEGEAQAERRSAAAGEPDVEAFVDYVVRSLVDEPAAVAIKTIEGDRQTTLQVCCAKTDVGKIIGKSGKTIAAIRTLTSGAAGRLGKKVNVEILD